MISEKKDTFQSAKDDVKCCVCIPFKLAMVLSKYDILRAKRDAPKRGLIKWLLNNASKPAPLPVEPVVVPVPAKVVPVSSIVLASTTEIV